MAERFGYKTIKDALVTLIGTTKVTDLNNGLAISVKQVITKKPSEIVIPDTLYPTVNVWLNSIEESFRGASKRIEAIATFHIDCWTHSLGSVDSSIDELQLLIDNILYIIGDNVGLSAITRGYEKVTGISFDYNSNESGFVSHAKITLLVFRYLN